MSYSHPSQLETRTPASPLRASSASLIAGGGLLIVMYALEIAFGLLEGRMFEPADLFSLPLGLAQALSFSGGLVLIALALLLLGQALRHSAPKLALSALLFAGLALSCGLTNLVLILGGSLPIGELGGLTVLSSLLALFLLGIAALRSRALSRSAGMLLLLVGLITFPAILLTIPLEALLPAYVIADLPFPIWGLVFVALGWLLARQPQG